MTGVQTCALPIYGRPLKLEVQDDQTTNAGAVAAFQRLIQSGNVTAIIGPIRSTEVQAITPYIERAQIPVIMGGTAPALTHEGDPWVFRTRPNDSYSAKALATFVVKTLHLSKVAVIHSSDAFGTGVALYALRQSGMKPQDEAYQRGVRFLLLTQRDNGSWHVASRAPKVQPYFQSGFPHNHDQWISAAATAWAVAALSEAAQPANTTAGLR